MTNIIHMRDGQQSQFTVTAKEIRSSSSRGSHLHLPAASLITLVNLIDRPRRCPSTGNSPKSLPPMV